MNRDEALVSRIQRFSIHDGPGVRTTVFLKGCNLHCFWCHNPETISAQPVIQFYPEKCIGCGECVKVCPVKAHKMMPEGHVIDRSLCIRCGSCAAVGYGKANVKNGTGMTCAQVMDEIMKDEELYLLSQGGITVSGGEPLLQHEWVRELFSQARQRKISCALDTAGNVPFSIFEEIDPYVDIYLYDLKCIDPVIHQNITGQDNERILENLKRLDEIASCIYIRMPVMKGVNDADELIYRTGTFLSSLKHIRGVDVLSIHTLGAAKYRSLDLDYSRMDRYEPLKQEEMEKIVSILRTFGLNAREH